MNNLDTPLNEDEIDRLGQFLMNRIDEGALTDEMDEGIFDISTLDGFFTAVVSGPVPIPPSVWLPKVWGDFEPEWRSAEAFSEIFTLMVAFLATIAASVRYRSPRRNQPRDRGRVVRGISAWGGIIVRAMDEWRRGDHRLVGTHTRLYREHRVAGSRLRD